MNHQNQNQMDRSKLFQGLEVLMNSPESPLKKEHRHQLSAKACMDAANGKKKKKDEDKERSKSRVESLGGV